MRPEYAEDWEVIENLYEPNIWRIASPKKWVATIQLNGEMTVTEQRYLMTVLSSAFKLLAAAKRVLALIRNLKKSPEHFADTEGALVEAIQPVDDLMRPVGVAALCSCGHPASRHGKNVTGDCRDCDCTKYSEAL